MTRVAVAGFSWGGLSNVLAAAKDERIKALVCMDGAVRYFNSIVTQAKYAVPEKLRTPLLFLAQTPASMEENIRYKEDMSGSFMSRMSNADVYLLTMYPMEHMSTSGPHISGSTTPPSTRNTRLRKYRSHTAWGPGMS
ncbi:MAG: hypothetical protein AB1437_02250 [Pseudomonadota bacterium]